MRPIALRNRTILLGSTLPVMAGTAVAPALPAIAEAFVTLPHAAFYVKWLLTVPALFIALCAPCAGVLLDRFGRRPVLLVSLCLFAVSGASAFWLSSFAAIFISRIFLGIAVAGLMSGWTTLLGDYFRGRALHRFMGLQAAYAGFGGVAFLLTGGFLADWHWRYPFLMFLGGLLLVPPVMKTIEETKRGENDWRQAGRRLPERVSRPALRYVYGMGFLGMMLFYLVPTQLPFLLSASVPASHTAIGAAMATLNLCASVTATQYDKIKSRWSFQKIFAFFFVVTGLGYLTLAFSSGPGRVLTAMVLSGIGFGLYFPNINVLAVCMVPASWRGRVVGGFTTFFLAGQFLCPLFAEPWIRSGRPGLLFAHTGLAMLLLPVIYFGGKKIGARPCKSR